jgi:hypothetical protein
MKTRDAHCKLHPPSHATHHPPLRFLRLLVTEARVTARVDQRNGGDGSRKVGEHGVRLQLQGTLARDKPEPAAHGSIDRDTARCTRHREVTVNKQKQAADTDGSGQCSGSAPGGFDRCERSRPIRPVTLISDQQLETCFDMNHRHHHKGG